MLCITGNHYCSSYVILAVSNHFTWFSFFHATWSFQWDNFLLISLSTFFSFDMLEQLYACKIRLPLVESIQTAIDSSVQVIFKPFFHALTLHCCILISVTWKSSANCTVQFILLNFNFCCYCEVICYYFLKVKDFFAQYPESGAGERYRKMALESIERNIYWMNTFRPVIIDWLKKKL